MTDRLAPVSNRSSACPPPSSPDRVTSSASWRQSRLAHYQPWRYSAGRGTGGRAQGDPAWSARAAPVCGADREGPELGCPGLRAAPCAVRRPPDRELRGRIGRVV